MTLLHRNSTIFKDMFSVPPSQNSMTATNSCTIIPKDGLTDETPIRLGLPFTVRKMDTLLRWYYRFSPEFPTLSSLISILELSTFLDMDIARAFAIQALGAANMGLSSAYRLSLGLSYHISEWIEPAFKDLMHTPANRIPAEDFVHLGPLVCHLVASTQAEIRALRLSIAFNPLIPPSHHPSCKNTVLACQAAWESAWWDGLARHYLHPDYPLSPHEALSKLETTNIIGVTTAC
ncbi:hypothetical protein JB92DRAFT_2815395 [Gautieria morchelliformis]|nr:hypothetical protein JB92DRAFT_2815395 [Gautieria morchelliformis]